MKAGKEFISSSSISSRDLVLVTRVAARASEASSGARALVVPRRGAERDALSGVVTSFGARPRKRFGVLVKSCTCSASDLLCDGEAPGRPADAGEAPWRGDAGAEREPSAALNSKATGTVSGAVERAGSALVPEPASTWSSCWSILSRCCLLARMPRAAACIWSSSVDSAGFVAPRRSDVLSVGAVALAKVVTLGGAAAGGAAGSVGAARASEAFVVLAATEGGFGAEAALTGVGLTGAGAALTGVALTDFGAALTGVGLTGAGAALTGVALTDFGAALTGVDLTDAGAVLPGVALTDFGAALPGVPLTDTDAGLRAAAGVVCSFFGTLPAPPGESRAVVENHADVAGDMTDAPSLVRSAYIGAL